MRKSLTLLTLSAAFAASSAWAQDTAYNQQTTTQNDDGTTSTSTTEYKAESHGTLRDEIVGLKPAVGVAVYTDPAGSTTTRGAAGLILDMNATAAIAPQSMAKNLYVGPQTGIVYSHLGAAGSNFWGSSPTSPGVGTGAYFFNIPLDLKVGYNFGDYFRLAGHGGGNLTYRSIAAAANLGSSSLSTGSAWAVYPNAGADVEFGFGKYVALIVRPDWTLAPGAHTFFTGLVGLNIALS